MADKNAIVTGMWLSDAVITASQKLLKESFPHTGSLQPTILGQNLTFEVQRTEFVQILHVNGCHWLTISTIGCHDSEVKIYDSLSCGPLTDIDAQVAALLCTRNKNIVLQYQHVQQQSNSSDCGAFAVAFATSLCHSENPAEVTYTQKDLRFHLLKCLESRYFTKFPCRDSKRKRTNRRVLLPVYCKCRMPEEGEMIQCNDCKEWYHRECVEPLTDDIWNNSLVVWKLLISICVDL